MGKQRPYPFPKPPKLGIFGTGIKRVEEK